MEILFEKLTKKFELANQENIKANEELKIVEDLTIKVILTLKNTFNIKLAYRDPAYFTRGFFLFWFTDHFTFKTIVENV